MYNTLYCVRPILLRCYTIPAGRPMLSDEKVRVQIDQNSHINVAVNTFFGYGVIDAEAAVQLAQEWVTVPKAIKCVYSAKHVTYVYG